MKLCMSESTLLRLKKVQILIQPSNSATFYLSKELKSAILPHDQHLLRISNTIYVQFGISIQLNRQLNFFC